jgi:hypothetical protein
METARFVPEQVGTQLTESQRTVAEIAFFSKFLNKCNDNAQGQLPWLQRKEEGTSKEIKNRHVMGLLDAYLSLPQGEQGKKKFEANWGEKSDYLVGQVEGILPALEEERDQLFSDAKEWDVKDKGKEIRKVYGILAKLPKEQQELIYERTALEPEKVRTKATRWGVTIGANVASTYALDGVASAVGVSTVWATDKVTNIVSDNPHVLESVPAPALLPVLGASYIAWWKGVSPNLEQNWHLLEETGMSSNALSKLFYDRAGKYSATKQKLLSKGGYVLWETVKEVPYYAAAFGAAAVSKDISTQESLIGLAGANLGAAAFERGLAYATKKFLKAKNGFHRRKSADTREEMR